MYMKTRCNEAYTCGATRSRNGYSCGNARQLQAQKPEDSKETKKETFLSISAKRLKSDQRELFDPQSDSKVTFGARNVFLVTLSLFAEKGKSLFLVSLRSDE